MRGLQENSWYYARILHLRCAVKERPLPKAFQEETVGINLSPMVLKSESAKGVTMESYRMLIEAYPTKKRLTGLH